MKVSTHAEQQNRKQMRDTRGRHSDITCNLYQESYTTTDGQQRFPLKNFLET